MKNTNKLIFEKSVKGRKGFSLPKLDVEEKTLESLFEGITLRAEAPNLPEVSEFDVARHYVELSNLNYGVDTGFYPLGSCTMKYNPKINEKTARLDGFLNIHPLQSIDSVQGALELLYDTEEKLSVITGMDGMCMQPAAGAHGELTGLMIMKAYHLDNNQPERTKIIVPDSAHGTNPASVSMVGYEVVQIATNEHGLIDIEELKSVLDDQTAGIMTTNPSTLGIFETQIKEVAALVHEAGGLLYYDGANMNAIMGVTTPGDMGFDIVHLNLHKTFSTPHGGGGPGSGPIGLKEKLLPYVPAPTVIKKDDKFDLNYDLPKSIGKIKGFYGNFGVIVRAYTYILTMGGNGLSQVSKIAVLNANYMMNKLKDYYELPYERTCMHEFVLSGNKQKELGVSTLDIAKRLLDYGYHAPTVYFPLIVNEAIMIEPTETESKETIDEFIEVMIKIAKECEENPEIVKSAPNNLELKRLDETTAARKPVLNCCYIY